MMHCRSQLPGTMIGHGYVILPSRQVDAVLGDSDVSSCAAWSTGHSATLSLVTWRWGPITRAALTFAGGVVGQPL